MKILLDECVPRQLKRELPDHDVKTVKDMGWLSVQNGNLLDLAETEFDIFITVDRNIEWQQSIVLRDIVLIVLIAWGNSLLVLKPLMPLVKQTLEEDPIPGTIIHISLPSSGKAPNPPV